MSALGQKQTFRLASEMSALPPKADMKRRARCASVNTGEPRIPNALVLAARKALAYRLSKCH